MMSGTATGQSSSELDAILPSRTPRHSWGGHANHTFNAHVFHGLMAKVKTLEVPPAQSSFTEAVDEDALLVPNMTGCDCGGMKTVTFTSAAVARSSTLTLALS